MVVALQFGGGVAFMAIPRGLVDFAQLRLLWSYTNDCFKLRVAACLPFWKHAIFCTMDAQL
jgi:hypothetical protein